MNPDSTEILLQKLCDLQQQQLDKLAELSKHLAETAADTRSSYEGYERQLAAYEKTLQQYYTDEPPLTRSTILIAAMLGVLAVSIIVSRFL